MAAATSVQAGVVLIVSVIASTTGVQSSAVRMTLIGLLALAMGGQNAVVRRLAVPDLTTTVLTLTVTIVAVKVRRTAHPVLVAGRAQRAGSRLG